MHADVDVNANVNVDINVDSGRPLAEYPYNRWRDAHMIRMQ